MVMMREIDADMNMIHQLREQDQGVLTELFQDFLIGMQFRGNWLTWQLSQNQIRKSTDLGRFV